MSVDGALGPADTYVPSNAEMATGESVFPGDQGTFIAVFALAPVGMLVVNDDGRIVQTNNAADILFGCKHGDLRSQPIETLIPTNLRSKHQSLLSGFAHHPSARPMAKEARLSAVKKSGDRISVDIDFNPVPSKGRLKSVVVWVTDNSTRDRAEMAETFVKELTQRARNMFSILSAISRQIARSNSAIFEFQTAFEQRLNSLSASYRVFEQADWQAASIKDLVTPHLEFVSNAGLRQIDIEGPDLCLAAIPAEYLGLAIHELATNAIKYGSLSVPTGRVQIRWDMDENTERLDFSWLESGRPSIIPPSRKGFGTALPTSIVPSAFGGISELAADAKGIEWHLHSPFSVVSHVKRPGQTSTIATSLLGA
jgi:PAS domain S-box-containing protein